MARIQETANVFTAPAWAGDYTGREHNLPGGSQVNAAQWETVTYTITTSGAALGATTIPVTALPVALPIGTVLDWTGPGELSTLTAAAALGATSLAVEPLDAAIEAGDTAPYTVTDASPVSISNGTLVGRTWAEQATGDSFGPAVAADDEIFFIINDVWDASINPDVELYRHESVVKTNFLPAGTWDAMAAGLQTKVRALYTCVIGQA